jgi:hypothetical protein
MLNVTVIMGSPFWILLLADDGTTPDPTLLFYSPRTTCPPPSPPPPTSNPFIFQQFIIWAFAPMAEWDGSATCPPGSSPGAVCPPSVGQALRTWVSGFVPTSGATRACSGTLTNYLGYALYSACLEWRQAWPIRWDFNDQTVDGQRLWGQNYGVAESSLGPGAAVTHTYEYDSRFNPISNCVRPCSKQELLGPVLPGYPNGTPAFQVQIQTPWQLWLCQSFTNSGSLPPQTCSQVDLRTLGAPARDFISSNVIPVPVLQYGATS